MTLPPINFPDSSLSTEHEITLDNGDTITYVFNGVTWVRKDSKVLDDLADVDVDFAAISNTKLQYLVYDPQGSGNWINSEIRSDGFLVYKGILDVNQYPPVESPVSGHVYVHEFEDPNAVGPDPKPLLDEWEGIQDTILDGGEKIVFNGNIWELFSDFEGSLLPDSLEADNKLNEHPVEIRPDGSIDQEYVEEHKYGWLSYEPDVPNRKGTYTFMPMTDEGLSEYESMKSWLDLNDIDQDKIDGWNANLSIDLDGVLTNGNSTFQRMRIGKDIRFRPINDDGKTIGRTLEAVLGDGTFRWDSKQYGDPSTEFITSDFINNNYFVAAEAISGSTPLVLTSSDRHNWTESNTTGILGNINRFSYSAMAKTYVAVTDGGHIYYSIDKVNWTESDANTIFVTSNVYGVDYAFNQFIAVGEGGKVASSVDGIQWTEITSVGTTNDLYDVKHSLNNIWMIVGDSVGFISIDAGVTWTQNLFESVVIRCVNFGNDEWAVGLDDSSVKISTDASPSSGEWKSYDNVLDGSAIQDIVYVTYNEYWMVVGDKVNYKLDNKDEWYSASLTGTGGTSYSVSTDGNLLLLAHSNGYLINGYLFNGGLFYDGELLVTEEYLRDVTSTTSLQSLIDTDVNAVVDGEVLVYRGGLWTSVPLAEVPEIIRFIDFIDVSIDPPTISDPGTLYIQHSVNGGAVEASADWPGIEGIAVTEGEYVVFSGADNEWHRSGGSAASQIKSDWNETDINAASFIYNKPVDLAEFENSSANPYIILSNLTLDNVVSNPQLSTIDPHITNTNIRVGEKLMLGSDENYLLAEDDKILYKENRIITDKDYAVSPSGGALGEAGIVIPGLGIDYNPTTGVMDVIIESLLTFKRIITLTEPGPVGDDVPGDFYLVGDGVTSLDSYWGFGDAPHDPTLPDVDTQKPVNPGDKVILNREGNEWVVIPDPLGGLAVLEILSNTNALVIDNDLVDPQHPTLIINDATSLRSGLLTAVHKVLLDTIQTSTQLVSEILISTDSPLTMVSRDVGGHPSLFPINEVTLDIRPTSISPNGYGVVNTIDPTQIDDGIKSRTSGTDMSTTQDTYLEASEIINRFIPYDFTGLPEVTAV